ncbi:xanthine dehydrogenase molybdopterin binding subunit [Bacteriovorax stolpii]|uniref:Xanthine dehydrogenase molybdopterin binding subunit n=1 Tax=Bacteriovorax stolpii TaxID=960 RepID=A0A2K9NXI2_BACTC|nr:xanthine dehydrogenase molybdopterin binding subunit [Bacteriovorax stolpii]AUN99484.1 xanthine dehydrogenase molybdopterin binding subunit [Bacteriovorax stolpii]TDP51110.1 xanthine dehydrogenase molybdenum binding subunit apoprotein [Bacteriovorax stolpii]
MSVGKSVHHDSAIGHVTGTSVFIDDRPRLKNEVFVGVIGAPVCAGKITKIDGSAAMKVDGVFGVFTAHDIPHNNWGTIVPEQPILAFEKIGYIDEPVCVIACRDEETFNKVKKLIKIEAKEEKPILSIDEAIEKKSILCEAKPFVRGNVDEVLKKSPHTLKGAFECGGQEHFYMESQATIAYPLENGQIEVHSSSQHPTETQHVVAHALGLDYSQVVCIVKRMGGGFGGKESQAAHFAAMAGLVAYKLNRPARLALTKDDDMMMTGKRHPFKNFYEVGFDDNGLVTALKVHIYANGGAYVDLTPSILDRAMFHADGCYYLENCYIEGKAVRTHQHSNTAFRGFGGPQGNMTMESIIEDIAHYLKKDSFEIRRLNLYGKESRNVTPYNQVVEHNVLPELFDKLHKDSDYEKRKAEIKAFNEKKNGKLRGLSMTGAKFGIAFTTKFLNQGNALVNIHLDGTIQVSTGATEMGQGVNTKMQQIAATCFGIPHTNVVMMPTSTEKNHNTSPTAASSGADINGGAVFKACEDLLSRLRWVFNELHNSGIQYDTIKTMPPVDLSVDLSHIEFVDSMVVDTKTKKSMAFKDLLKQAYLNQFSLAGYAFYKTPDLGFDKNTCQGRAFNYFTNGAAVSEVEIDEYTGELKVLRTDILMDLGRPINPGIDIGQVSGAFVQGMGWVTTENLFYHESGKLLAHSPTTYKIPNIQDTPRVFNVELLENHTNTRNVMRSKAVGEPPLLLGASVWTAVKNALFYRSKGEVPHITSPATNEVILMELNRYE